MFRCQDCGALFEVPAEELEFHPEIDGEFYERYSVCPDCGCGAISEVDKCAICGEYCQNDTHRFCEECIATFKKWREYLSFELATDIDDINDLIDENLYK